MIDMERFEENIFSALNAEISKIFKDFFVKQKHKNPNEILEEADDYRFLIKHVLEKLISEADIEISTSINYFKMLTKKGLKHEKQQLS